MQPHWNRAGLCLLACWLVVAGGAAGEEPAAKPSAPSAPPTAAPPAGAPVDLDRLLQLPPATETPRERIGNATKGEWRSRFTSARLERDAAQHALAAAQKKLADDSGGSDAAWQMAPPVGSASPTPAGEVPANYAVRMEIRRQRDELARCEKRLQELTIEADLAGVPGDWRE